MGRIIAGLATGVAALGTVTGTAEAATTITIPWNLNFTFVSAAQTGAIGSAVHGGTIGLQAFQADHDIQTRVKAKVEVPVIGTDLAGIDVTAGLGFDTMARNSYSLSLPFEITLTAPDHARAGSYATIATDVHFSSAPSMHVDSQLGYGTRAFAHGSAFVGPFDGGIDVNAQLPDHVPLGGGSGITFGGSDGYSAGSAAPHDVSIGPFAHQSLSSGQRIADGPDRFAGTQLQTEGRVSAQHGEVNLLDIIEKIPVVGSAAAVANTVLDLDLEAGVDLVDRSTFSTGALYALYTDNGFATTHTAALNRLGSTGFSVFVPETATGDYSIDFYGLGLGFGLLQEALLAPELRLVLDAIWPLGEWELLKADLGDPWLIGRQTSTFQYEEFFQYSNYGGYIPPALRTLTIGLDGQPSDPPGTYDPTAPAGAATGFEDLAGLNGSASLPGTAPTEGVAVAIPAVPEPASWATMLLGFGLVGTAARRRPPPAAAFA